MAPILALLLGVGLQQPVPRPFPKPGDPPAQPAPVQPSRPQPAAPQTRPAARGEGEATPTQEQLGLPLYPGAQFLVSFNAGQGQRYYLYGTNATFGEIVAYYKAYLRDGGERVFDEPPTHMFEVGRYREETMAFPPGITVKDYTWGGSQGWLNPKPNAQPARFKTIIQIVPAPPAPPR